MSIKTFRGRTPAEALAQVKRELGADAVILHTKTGKAGGMLGLGTRSWTEITATSGKHTARPRPPRSTPQPTRANQQQQARAASARAATIESNPLDAERRDIVELVGAAAGRAARDSEPRRERPAPRPPQRMTPDLFAAALEQRRAPEDDPIRAVARTVAAGARTSETTSRSVEQDIALIRRMVGQVLQTSRGGAATAAMPDALEECYLSLLEADVAAEIADDVAGRVRDELTPAELTDRAVVRQTVLRRLASLIPVHDEPISTTRPTDGRPRTIALVGPTGVGKTTTIAKLAATYKLRLRKRVGLVTSDTYRIAAVDQLRTYANIIGLPLEVTLTPTEMQRAVRSLSDCDVILIDTAGRSQHDQHRVDELRTFVEAANPHETHLVLSSTAGESVLRRTVGVFGAVRPTHVIFTKLDEAVNFGVLVNVIRNLDARLSFVTTGQEVPDQIERGNADRIARLVLDGGRAGEGEGGAGGARS